MSEEELIDKCVANDRKAQKALYDMYSPIMLGICIRYVYERSEAEDILQEGFLKVFTNIKEFAHRGSFEGWMKRIFVNTAITHYHKNIKHNKNHYQVENFNVKDDNSFVYGESEFTRDELLKVIQSLPKGYRLVFNLYAIDGYKHREIAEMLKIDVNTSKSQYSRAKNLIRKKLAAIKTDIS